MRKQAKQILANLEQGSIQGDPDAEVIALIAYMQRLGTDIKGATPAPQPPVQTTQQPARKETAQAR